MICYKLPRRFASLSGADELLKALFLNSVPLVPDSPVSVPELRLTVELQNALRRARRAGQIVQGFENAQEVLGREAQGISLLKHQDGQGQRISRLILLSNDGAAGFYQKADRLLRKHVPRVLGCRLDADSNCLGELVFGRGRVAKLVLIAHKDAVAEIFLPMAGGIE